MTMEMRRGKLKAYPTTRADLLAMGFNMREADRREIAAWTGGDPVFRMAYSAEQSDWCVTVAEIDGNAPVCIFGVARHPHYPGGQVGQPWLVATESLESHAFTFLRMCGHFVGFMLEAYPVLENYVDARNTLAVKWLEWCGFTVKETVSRSGVEKVDFYRMGRRA